MGRQVLLLIAFGIFGAILSQDTSDGFSAIAGTVNDGVEIHGTKTLDGKPGDTQRKNAVDTKPRPRTGDQPAPVVVNAHGLCPDDLKPCANFAKPPAPAKPPTPGTPAVTLADIASFRPVPVPSASEPNGWGVVGLDTNFVSSGSSQIVTGTLLGRPASVRFTPVAYGWSYGDGSARTSTSSGGTWEALRLREFDPTPSSHAYRAIGDYSARVVVQYAAEYSWGDPTGFTAIDGTVTAAADPVPVHIVTESTVLVGSDCTVTPAGPGC